MFEEFPEPMAKATVVVGGDFFDRLRNAVVGYGWGEPKSRPDWEPFRMDFNTLAGNRFSACLQYDERGGIFVRILGLVKYLESDEEALYFLMKNGCPGVKIFLDNDYFEDDYWQAVLSFDHPLAIGIPVEPSWFTNTLTWLDCTLGELKGAFQPI